MVGSLLCKLADREGGRLGGSDDILTQTQGTANNRRSVVRSSKDLAICNAAREVPMALFSVPSKLIASSSAETKF